ncbi:hypothetical protein [Cytobacillus sp. IB215665]|uniref:hypothetical protein n=1 Tax=Cytobacillus sp. IB215665 TaxID=3097357 RepID=UPI002A14BA2D|nr:hypothetical protein [Cytobacillus sp. IB215665]MDX8363773.1 hypothetical protein [Cytobacillus sp. IB215665]
MVMFSSAPIDGVISNNGMYVSSNENGTEQTEWKQVFDDEARKINPLFDVKVQRNDLILDSIQNNDWSKYHDFQAKQHPAWYETVNGQATPNKVYYGMLIENNLQTIKEAELAGDREKAVNFQKNLEENIEKFNNAPGVVPYIVGLNSSSSFASKYGVSEPSSDFFDSKWNSPLVVSQGKFEQNMWYDNAYIAENSEMKNHLETLVAGSFPTSQDISEPTEIIAASVKETDVDNSQPVEDDVEVSNQDVEDTTEEVVLQNLLQQKLQYKPSFDYVKELYEQGI